jgi:hypothetical protein
MLVTGVTLRPLEPRRSLQSLCLTWRRDRANLPVIRSFREHVAGVGLRFAAPGHRGFSGGPRSVTATPRGISP